jgi:hypothetical protein
VSFARRWSWPLSHATWCKLQKRTSWTQWTNSGGKQQQHYTQWHALPIFLRLWILLLLSGIQETRQNHEGLNVLCGVPVVNFLPFLLSSL